MHDMHMLQGGHMANQDERCPHCDSRQHRNCGLSFDDYMIGLQADAVNAVHDIMDRTAGAENVERHNARTCPCEDCRDERDYQGDLEYDRRRDDEVSRG
jgi:hypothetical protein